MNREKEIEELIAKLSKKETKECLEFLVDKFRGTHPLLRILKDRKEGVSAGEIAKRLNVSTARIAVILCNLEFKKLILRKKDKDDARKVMVFITKNGTDLLNKIDGEIYDYFVYGLNRISEEELKSLNEIIGKLQGDKKC